MFDKLSKINSFILTLLSFCLTEIFKYPVNISRIICKNYIFLKKWIDSLF